MLQVEHPVVADKQEGTHTISPHGNVEASAENKAVSVGNTDGLPTPAAQPKWGAFSASVYTREERAGPPKRVESERWRGVSRTRVAGRVVRWRASFNSCTP